jgi:Tol biopolymer transport system component
MTFRRVVAATALLLTACGDDDGVSKGRGPEYDLAFAGEVSGVSVLMRTKGSERTIQRLGIGIPGIGAVTDPSGSRVLFTTLGNANVPPRLAMLDSVRAEPRNFTDDIGSYEREPSWSPAGDRVAYTSLRDDGMGDVVVANVAGGTVLSTDNLTLDNGGLGVPDMTPSWSPDGTRLAFTSYRSGAPSVWIMNADGSRLLQVTSPGNAGDYFPSWSPAGDSIAFQRIDASSSRIGLVAATGGTPRFLTLPGDAFAPVWAPDAARLAVSIRDLNLDLDVYVISTDGNIVERVRRPGNDYQPHWIPATSRF